MPVRRVILLGSAGSIGTQTLDTLAHLNALHARNEYPDRFEVVGLSTGKNEAVLHEQARTFNVKHLALAVPARENAHAAPGVRTLTGPDAAEELVRTVEADIVVAAMVGASGLPATLAAAQLGRDIALANKETLVAAGSLIVPAAKASDTRLLPVDSEHSAIWQCLQGATPTPLVPPCEPPASVARIILTASGGPFRTRSREEVYHATPAEALNHPTWSMGAKVTVDSASLTNKAFEVLEAHWLFGLPGDRIDVLIHPQSIVHSMVEFADGSVIAQLGSPDMRGPIQYALTFPNRPPGIARKLDLHTLSRLDFQPPDPDRFPALALTYRCIREGGTSGAIFNAASEEAVNAFLAGHDAPKPALAHAAAHTGSTMTDRRPSGRIPFGRIPELAAQALDAVGVSPLRNLADVLEADRLAREFVRSQLA